VLGPAGEAPADVSRTGSGSVAAEVDMFALKPVCSGVLIGVVSLAIPVASVDAADQAGAQAAAVSPQSADAVMARIVAEYRRHMLDRGGWENPYLPSTALGNALASVSVGGGVTLAGNELASEAGAEGAASGEPAEPERQ
jgi:hypothetical protein